MFICHAQFLYPAWLLREAKWGLLVTLVFAMVVNCCQGEHEELRLTRGVALHCWKHAKTIMANGFSENLLVAANELHEFCFVHITYYCHCWTLFQFCIWNDYLCSWILISCLHCIMKMVTTIGFSGGGGWINPWYEIHFDLLHSRFQLLCSLFLLYCYDYITTT